MAASSVNVKLDHDVESTSNGFANHAAAPMASDVKQEPSAEASAAAAQRNGSDCKDSVKEDLDEKPKPYPFYDNLDSASTVGYNRRNEEKETFVCEICDDMQLTSRQTMVCTCMAYPGAHVVAGSHPYAYDKMFLS
jgi:hypothetical protein